MPNDTLPLDAQVALADYRARVLAREPISFDEYRVLIRHLRESRENASRVSAAARRTAKRTVHDTTPALALDTLFPSMEKNK